MPHSKWFKSSTSLILVFLEPIWLWYNRLFCEFYLRECWRVLTTRSRASPCRRSSSLKTQVLMRILQNTHNHVSKFHPVHARGNEISTELAGTDTFRETSFFNMHVNIIRIFNQQNTSIAPNTAYIDHISIIHFDHELVSQTSKWNTIALWKHSGIAQCLVLWISLQKLSLSLHAAWNL